jgi:hypothetical protein
MRAHRFIRIPAAACTWQVKTYASVSPIIIQTKGGKAIQILPKVLARPNIKVQNTRDRVGDI